MNHRLYQSLSPQQKIDLKNLNQKYQDLAWEKAEKQTSDMTKKLADNGMLISPITQSLSKSLQTVGNQIANDWREVASQAEQQALNNFLEQSNAQ